MNELIQQQAMSEMMSAIGSSVESSDRHLYGLLSPLFGPTDPSFFEKTVDLIEEHLLERVRCGVPEGESLLWWEHADGSSLKGMFVGSGGLVIGRQHLTHHHTIMQEGAVLMFSSSGPFIVRAPTSFSSKPGARKIGIVLEDMKVYNVVPNPSNSKDVEALEDGFSKKSEFQLAFESSDVASSKDEYDMLMKMLGTHDSDVKELMSEMWDGYYPEMPDGFVLGDSTIEGQGVLAERDIEIGEEIPMVVGQERNQLARWTNHSFRPNTKTVSIDGDVYCVATTKIHAGDEITTNYLDNMRISEFEARKELCLV